MGNLIAAARYSDGVLTVGDQSAARTPPRQITTSVFPGEQVIGELTESHSTAPEWLERSISQRRQPTGFSARAFQTEERGIGGLLRGDVLAGALAKLFACLRNIEDVVDHLKSESEVMSEPAHAGNERRPGVNGHGT